MPRLVTLPDMSRVYAPDGISDEQALLFARDQFPNAFPSVKQVEQPKPPEEMGDFMRGLADYVPQMKGIYGAAKVATGVGAQKLLGKGDYTDEMIKAGLETIKSSEGVTQGRAKESDSFTKAWEKGIGSVVTDYIPYMLGQGVGNIGESLAFSAAGAGIGSLAGSAVPVAGTAAGGVGGALTGLLAKSLLKTEIKDIAKKLAAEQGVKVAEAYVAKEAAKIAPKVLGSAIGNFAGSAAQAGLHGVGEVAGRAIEELQKEGKDVGEMDFNTLAPAMLLHSGADFLAARIGLGSLKAFPKKEQNLFAAIAERILKTGLKEIPAELTQQVAERFGAKLNLVDADAMREYVDTIAAAFIQPGIGATFGGVRSYLSGNALNIAPKTEFDQSFLNILQENKASGNFSSNSDSLYDAREKALTNAAVGSNMTVYDSVGRDAEAMITGYTETGIPTIKVDASGTDRTFVLGQEYDVISPVNKDIRLSDNTPVSQLSGEDVQNRMAILKPLVDSNRIELANGNDLVQHHVMERDLAALVAQDAFNATIPVSAKAAINKGNKEKRDRVKNNANGVPVVDTGAITPLTTATEVTTEPLAASAGQAAATPLPVVDQAAEDAKQAETPKKTVEEILAQFKPKPTVDPNAVAAEDPEQAAIDAAIEEEAKKQEEDAAFKRGASGSKRVAKPQTATAFLLKKGPLSKTFTGTDVRTDIYGDKKGINQRLFSGTLGLDDAATMLRLAGWDITEGSEIDDIKRILRDEANGIKHYAAKDQEEVFRRQAENDQKNKQAAAAAEVNAPLLDDQGETTLTFAGDKRIPFSKTSGKAAPAYKVNTGAQKLIATIKEERQKKQYEAALPRVALLIAKRMKQLGLNINVEKLMSIVEVGADGKPSMEGKINGQYFQRVITLAIAGKSDAQIMSTLNHEAIHALRKLDMITESEWVNLTKVVENKGWINLFQIPTRYTSQNLDGKTEDEILTILSKEAYFQETVNGKSVPQTKVEIKEQLVEEAIADAFSTYATGRSPIIGYLDAEQTKPTYIYKAQLKLGGQPVGIITRLIKMLRGIREVVSGEEVFKRIQEAPMASPVAVAPAAVAVAPAAVAAPRYSYVYKGSDKSIDRDNPRGYKIDKIDSSDSNTGKAIYNIVDSSGEPFETFDTRADAIDYIKKAISPVRYSKTPEFKRFTHGNQIINLNEKHKFVDGVPVVVQVVHGTTGDYEFFDRSKLNQESDLGAGFYFTNSLADVNANYAGMGPDLTNKVERTAERIASETDREYNDPDVIEEARNQFLANEGQVMPVYVRFDNPVVLGGKKETFLDFDQNYNEKTEEYGEPTGKFVDFVEALKNIAGNERYGNVNVDKVVSDLYEKVTDNDGISANDLIKTAKKSDGLVYAEDYEKDGELASTEIIRLAFEEIGYDGFIDQTVVNKFSRRENIKGEVVQKPMAGVTEDTVHFIAFKQNQVKSSVGNLGSYGERSLTKGELEQEGITAEEAKARQKLGYIRYSATAKPTDTPAFKRWFGDSKVVDENGKPLAVYHGSLDDISEFKEASWFAKNLGNGEEGFFFTESPIEASLYATKPAHRAAPKTGGAVYKVYLSLQNPAINMSVRAAKKAGHDGVIYTFKGSSMGRMIVAFSPTQIKSATGNRGTFDPTNPDIRYSKVAKTEEQKAVDKGNLRVKGAAIREEKLGSAAIVSARPGNVVATITGITPDKIKNLHRRAAAIINTKAAKAFFATLGVTKVEAITIGGLRKGVAEPSFFLTAKDANGDNLSYDKMRGIANILGNAFQQDVAITSEGLNKPKPTDKVNTTLFLGKADGSVLNERETSGVFNELSTLGIEGASITTDNKAFKVLWFSDDKISKEQNTQNLEAFSTGLRDAVRAYGIDGYYLGYTRSNLDDQLEEKDGVYRSRSKESLREAWDTDVAGRSSLLFGGATDHFLVPYILSVKAEGGQFDFNRWQFLNEATDAERAGLEQKVLAYDAIVNEVGLSPEEAASVNLLIGRTGLGDKDTFAIGKVGGLPDIVRHLDQQRNASGLRKLDVNNEDDRETLSKLMAAEAVAAVRGSGNAIDWYDAEIKKTLDIMAVKYPELTTDPVARLAFRIAMAITSQTLNVEANFRFAMKQYEGYRKSKGLRKFPIDGEGKSIAPMKANFTKANYLLAALGPTTFPRFLVTDFTVKELSSMGIKINGENMDTDLLGSVVFGPKIGYGFLSNLMGNFEPTTFDMWFMRLVGRLTGNLPQFKQSLFDNQLANFIRSFEDVGTDGVYADKFDPKLLRDVANSTDNAEILKLAKKVVTAHEADYKEYREQYDPKFGIPTRRRTPFVSAAFGIVKSLEKPKDSPASGTERNNLRDVMKKLVAKMTTLNGGVRIPPAALQALVWYPEQFLYESMGAKLRVTGQSYSGAATKIIKETKITSQQKEDVEKIASRKTVPGVAVEKAAVPFTQAEKSAFLNKYKNQFNITVKESDDADVIQDIEDETPGNKVRVTTKPFSIARFVGDSSKEKRSVVPDTNFYRETSYMMSLADYMGKPIHLYVGTEKNTLYQKPYGLMHILDNAAKSTARRFENLTDNDSENAVRGVMNILGARDVVAYSETAGKVLLRSESNKAYVVLGDSMSGWSVISVVPSMDARKFGNAIINRGQKVTLEEKFFPARLFANAPLVRSIEFVPYSKAPSVEIKKRRVVEIPKMSVARYSGATIPKYPTTLLGGASIPRAWQSPASDKLTNLQYIFTDKFIDLKNVMKAITSTMGQVSDQFNAYLREELFHGRVAKQVFDFAKDELRPLLASMQSLNVTIPEIELYLQNRTAESYNTKIAAIGGMADGGSGILTADARAYLASIPPAKLYAYTSLAKRVDAMTKKTRELMVAGGLEDRATINAWETANPQYVPLQRDLGRDEGVSGMGQGFSVTHKVARAMGSTKSVKDILANIVATRERTIVKSEKNKIGQAVLGLALGATNPDYWLAIDPNGNKNKAANFTDLLNMGLSINEATMIAQEPKVRYTDSVTGMIAERVNPMIRNMPNVLHVMVNGKERLVIFNPDEKHPANRLVRTLKNLDIGELGPIMGWVAKVTRWIAAINTQYNPIFGVINFLRDYQTGLLNLSSTPLAGMQGQIAGDTFPAMMGIFAQMRSYKTGVPATGRWAKLYEDFEKAGGPTGYREMFATSEDRADALASEFKQLTEGRAKKIGRGVLDALSNYNTAMENAVRLAAFDAGVKKGLSVDQAASIAKNLTVNFNRKGDIAMQAGALYAFFNASAQGSARIAQTLSGPAGRKILGGALTLGVMQAVALAAAGFGDDEPPEFIKDKNLVIPTGDGKYITIPMPLGFNIIPSFSRMMTEVTFYGKGNQTKKIVGWMNGAFGSLNPLGGGVAAQTIFPSAVDPIIALLQNKDAFGRRIYKEDISGLTPTAGYLRTKETATPWAKGLAEFMNMATGGTQFKQGIISPTPDQIDYLIGQATGGIGRESAKIAQTISSSATGEELPSYKIPLVSRFFGDTKEGASVANKFYENLIRVNEHGVELKGYREHRGSGNAALYIKENPEARLVPMARHTQEVLSNLNKQKRLALERDLPRERIKQIEELAKLQMRRFNERVEAMR